MSRSYKHTAISSRVSVGSQKWFRTDANQAKRRKVSQMLHTEQWDILPHDKEYGDEWSSPRDGKWYFGDMLVQKCFNCRFASRWGYCTCDQRKKEYKEYMRR